MTSATDGIAYITGGDYRQLYALNSQTGQVLWQFTAYSLAEPIVANGVVYFGDNAGYLYAVWAGEPAK